LPGGCGVNEGLSNCKTAVFTKHVAPIKRAIDTAWYCNLTTCRTEVRRMNQLVVRAVQFRTVTEGPPRSGTPLCDCPRESPKTLPGQHKIVSPLAHLPKPQRMSNAKPVLSAGPLAWTVDLWSANRDCTRWSVIRKPECFAVGVFVAPQALSASRSLQRYGLVRRRHGRSPTESISQALAELPHDRALLCRVDFTAVLPLLPGSSSAGSVSRSRRVFSFRFALSFPTLPDSS
jgi:hypothetical protein